MIPSNHGLAVEIHDLHVMRGRTRILDGLSCSIPAARCAAILGPNGSGKTTLMRVLTGQMFITRGLVRVLGETIGQTDIRALRRRIGVVNPSMGAGEAATTCVVDADLTAHEAVLTGFFGTIGLYDTATQAQRDRADEVLAQVGLSARRDLRFGLLSTGEQRRCMVARALVHLPELLILDEATAGLDLLGREQVLATVERILDAPHAPTVLFISHHVEELSPRARHVVLLREGRVVAAGPMEMTLTGELLSRTFGCSVEVRKYDGRYWPHVPAGAWEGLIAGTT